MRKGSAWAYSTFSRMADLAETLICWHAADCTPTQVLFTVNLGKDGNGLEFAATSISPTADPMLRGIWHFRATDRDLARQEKPFHSVPQSNSFFLILHQKLSRFDEYCEA